MATKGSDALSGSSPPLGGTLTFLFADLRDYTAFVEAHGDATAAALIADYRRLVRNEVAKHAGAEIKTEGDSFFVVFQSARQALQCAINILREAERQSRPERPLRIGVGLHAGEPLPHEDQYVGSAVNLAARLAAAAGPGELLVSEVVRALLRTSGAPPMEERSGLALKGVEDPPRVYAVSWRLQAQPARAAVSGEVAIEAAPPLDRRILCPELIAREEELATLEAFLQETLAGGGRTVLVAGEAGIGKSALLRRFTERARGLGALVLQGECSELEVRRPFGPFVEILRESLRERSSGELPSAAADLLGLLPELAGGRASSEQPLAEAERYRVHEAIARHLGERAQAHPLLAVVEDLHWADEATLELFPYLARKLRQRPVLLLGSYRSDELHRLHPLNHLLAELARARLAEEVRLRRLALEETGAVIRAALGLSRPPTTEFRAAIQERCEGNPFFIEEILKALVEGGDLSYRDGAWRRTKDVLALAIPVSVRDAVQQRLRLLSAEARRAVQVAAVIGQRFDFELLRRVSGMSEEGLLEALRAAVEAQLLGEVPDHGGEELYAFRHALTRESVLAELLQRERRLLHRAVGEAIEALPDAFAYAEGLAYHFDQARDQERAFRYHDLAAREALRVFAFARATAHLERAVELAPDDDPSLGHLQLRLAEAASLVGDFGRAARAAEEGRRLFESAGDLARLAATLHRLSFCRWMLGETREAHELGRESARLLEPLGESAELAGVYAQMAALAGLDARYAEAIAYGERAIAMARATNAPSAEVDGLRWVGMVMAHQGNSAGIAYLRQSLDLALKHELVEPAQRGFNSLFVALHSLGAPFAERRGVYEEAVEHARRYSLRFDPLIMHECNFAFFDGEWDRLLALVEESRGDSIWSAVREAWAALVEGARNGPERGLQLLEGPHGRLLAAGDPQWVAYATRAAALLHFIADDLPAVLAEGEGSLPLITRGFPHSGLDLVQTCALLAAERQGDAAALERWLKLALKPAGGPGPLTGEARRAFARALRAKQAGDREAAIASFLESARLFDESWTGMVSTFARLEGAELLLQGGDAEGAAAELAAILPYWRKAKATWYLGKLREWAEARALSFPGE